ncbi:MAG: nucleotidyl transferase AbiEii/AbiGii toxin family protein [Saprospiraceae bacterium]|nr:nucleotidyl transferase AbiEii/AbiGii toxin family protein [Saprospiraceae bacterium]
MNTSPSKEQFEQAAAELAVDPAMVEKDWYVVQVLTFLSGQNFPGFEIVFSGGTALSKAHGLIQRFSEDVDFRVISTEDAPNRQKLSEFKNAIVNSLRQTGFRVSDPVARDSNRYFTVDIEYDTFFDRHNALRPHIKLEVKIVSPQLPVKQMPVGSFLAQLANRAPEVKGIACIDPVETAADKLSALAWRIPNRVRGGENDDPAIVRHIHDLAVLENHVKDDARFPRLVAVSMQLDNDTLLKNKPAFGSSNAEKFEQMLSILTQEAEYRKEYDQFVKGVSYAPEGAEPDFDTALGAVSRLTQIVLASI